MSVEDQQEAQQVVDQQEQQNETQPESDDIVVTIGDEEPLEQEEQQQSAPEWVKELRKSHREAQRELRELRAKVQQTEQKPPELGKKPALEDYDYDTSKYEEALAAWFERKREADAKAAQAKAEEEKQQSDWQSRLAKYESEKATIGAADYEDAEAVVKESLNLTQQGIIVKGAKNPAILILALGRNQAKAKELAAITDPVDFTWAVAQLEKDLKVTSRKAPPPEKVVRGSAPVSGGADSTLERLRQEAEKTGNYSKVAEYKRQLRNKGK